MMVALADFSPFILPYADGCPEFVIQDAVLAAIQDFYRLTKEKEVEPTAIDIVAAQGVYTISVENAHVFEISSVLYGSSELDPADPVALRAAIGHDWRAQSARPRFYYLPELDKIRLVATPDESLAGGLTLACTVYPSRTATSFDDILLEEHRETIMNGALARLLTQQDRPWTDFKQGVARGMMFQAAVEKHASRVNRGRVRSKRRIVGHYF